MAARTAYDPIRIGVAVARTTYPALPALPASSLEVGRDPRFESVDSERPEAAEPAARVLVRASGAHEPGEQ
jgi:hypothetical protein